MSVREAKKTLSAQVAWFASARGLINRSDREQALLERFSQVTARYNLAEGAVSNIVAAAEDDPSITPDVIARIRCDLTQVADCMDDITEKARSIQAQHAGQPVGVKGASPGPGIISRLPALDLPTFRGQIDQWVGFINLFDSLVDKRDDLTPSQKLAYLMSRLQGEARDLVSHLQVTDSGYLSARDLLHKRYQNIRRLADAHISQILGLPKATPSTLRLKLLNPLVVAVNALDNLKFPVKEWSYILLHIVLAKLPTELRSRFEQAYGGDSATYLPPFSDLLKFLEDECRMADNAPQEEAAPRRDQKATPPANTRGREEPRQPRRFLAADVIPEQKCACCRALGHAVAECNDFAQKRVRDRRFLARQRQWCYSCLEAHQIKNCRRLKPCTHCGGTHHPLLCLNKNGETQDGFRNAHTGGGVTPQECQAGPREQRDYQPAKGGGPSGQRQRLSEPQAGMNVHQASHQASRRSPTIQEAPRLEYSPPATGWGPKFQQSENAEPSSGTYAQQSWQQSTRFSPPLHEAPRLTYRTPPLRSGSYAPPPGARCARRPYQAEFNPLAYTQPETRASTSSRGQL